MKRQVGRLLLKARVPALPPSGRQVEHERSLWGPSPIPGVTEAEDLLYLTGERFLMRLYGAAIGLDTKGRQFRKAVGDGPIPQPAGWGDLAKLFLAGGDPAKQVAAWESVVDKLLGALLPQATVQQTTQAWAVRTFLLGKLGDNATKGTWPDYRNLLPSLERRQVEVLSWTAARGAAHVQGIADLSRKALRDELTLAAMEKVSTKELQGRLYDRFSAMNRDWRRLAVTETAAAVQNAALASVNPKDGWEVQWVAAAKACPFCQKMDGRRFRIVDAKNPAKDGQTQVWVGKNNVGRSASKRDKDGNVRTVDELWWPCLPAHPACGCRWVLRRPKVELPGKIQASVGSK